MEEVKVVAVHSFREWWRVVVVRMVCHTGSKAPAAVSKVVTEVSHTLLCRYWCHEMQDVWSRKWLTDMLQSKPSHLVLMRHYRL